MLAQLDSAFRKKEPHEPATERLLIVSNRGPFEHSFTETGRITRKEAGGGVATALYSVAKSHPVTWIAAAGSTADRVLAIGGHDISLGEDSSLRLVNIPEDAYHLFYESFCNPILWFLQHSLTGQLQSDDLEREARESWAGGYMPVNRAFADAVIAELRAHGGAGRVMLHDYHFYVAPRMVREACPDVAMQQFIHIPWPGLLEWEAVPADIVREICRGLLGNDSLVFQTDASVENFLATCAAYLGDEARISSAPAEVTYRGRTTSLWDNPISVDAHELALEVSSPEAQAYKERLRPVMGEKTIMRVDRLDPSKNIAAGFESFERLLEKRPEWRGKAKFVAFLVPSRTSIPEYKAYTDRVLAIVDRINARFGTDQWRPVELFYEQNRLQALAGMTMYDVLVVNSLLDGMNLVSKEGPVVNERDGILVLSETAGSHEELKCGALSVRPIDIEGTADALHQALSMSPEERRKRAEKVLRAIQSHQLNDWLRLQIKDLLIAEYMKTLKAGERVSTRREAFAS
jgi:trehalose 6-phosphate synthase